jgi:hypothetical protein
LRIAPGNPHNPVMTLKSAAVLALIGNALITILLTLVFVNNVYALVKGVIPSLSVLGSFLYLFASITITIFFYVFQKNQR